MKISKSALMSFIAEEMKEVLLGEDIVAEADEKEKTKTLKLPKLSISENFGDPKSTNRAEVEKYINKLPGNSLEEKINSINTFLNSCKKAASCKVEPSIIISNLVILNTLTSILEDYHAGGAGHLMEAFIAALIGGRQVPVKSGKGVTDVQKGREYYSIKFVSDWGAGGSWLNLKHTFNNNRAIEKVIYYYLKKRGGDKRGDEISFYKIELDKNKIEEMWRERHPESKFPSFFDEEFDRRYMGMGESQPQSLGSFSLKHAIMGEPVAKIALGSGPMKKLASRYTEILGESINTLFDQLDQLIDNTNKLVMGGDSGAGEAAKNNLVELKNAVVGVAASTAGITKQEDIP